jgi:cellulose synthase (UDP-forming)
MSDQPPESPRDTLSQSVRISGLALCTVLFVILVVLPLDAIAQLYAAVSILVLIYFTSSQALRCTKVWYFCRLTAMILAGLLTIRYLFWRGMYTLQADEILSLIAMGLLFLAEIYSGLVHLLGCFVNALPLNRPKLSLKTDLSRKTYPYDAVPTVDIMVPTYNESVELLEITLRAARMLDYPSEKLTIHLLDDGGTEAKLNQQNQAAARQALERKKTLQQLCRTLGVRYHTRKQNQQAKAGNINSALPNTDSELIVILDADHIPTTDFLDRTVPWMIKNDQIFLVQTPHFMINPDPVERNYLASFTRMPSENDMFYGTVQKGLDFWSSSFFCGSAAILRRRHLDLVGGIAGDSITEDAETALELHSLGYQSVYVDQPLISGLAAETTASFIQQRVRWAQGMTQIFLLKKPYRRSGLHWYQRFGYLSSILFWMFPFARLVFLLSPLAYLVLGLNIIHASFIEIMAYTIPHVIATYRISDILFGRNRWPLVSELYEILQCAFTLKALLKVFRNPKEPSFIVTPKGENLDTDSVSALSGVFYWLLALTGLAGIAGIYKYIHFPLLQEMTLMVLVWNTFNFILILGLLEVLIEKRQLRKYSRLPAYDDVDLHDSEGHSRSANLVDLSVEGAKISCQDQHEPLPRFMTLTGYSNALRKKVRLSCEVLFQNPQTGEVRVKFLRPDDAQSDQVIAFALGDSARWKSFQQRRTRPISYFYGLRHVLNISLKPVFRHIWLKHYLRRE